MARCWLSRSPASPALVQRAGCRPEQAIFQLPKNHVHSIRLKGNREHCMRPATSETCRFQLHRSVLAGAQQLAFHLLIGKASLLSLDHQ